MGWGWKNPFKVIVDLGKSIINTVVDTVMNVVGLLTSVTSSFIISTPTIPSIPNAPTTPESPTSPTSPTSPSSPSSLTASSSISGSRQQIAAATNNKLPIVYGSAYVGGTIIDVSISSDNQEIYYVLAICEVTNTQSGSSPDTFTFGDIYYGGKLVIFNADGYTVDALRDPSTGLADSSVYGKIKIYLYRNGSANWVNYSSSAITVMQSPNLVYKWDANKTMTNTVFAIVKLNYNETSNVTSLQSTRFQVTNSRSSPGACLSDYMISTRYGAAIPTTQIDTTSLTALDNYCSQLMSYTTFLGITAYLTRFRFDGILDTGRTIQSNMQIMADCCDCLIKYNEIQAKWGVIVQSPSYTVAMGLNDSNIISPVRITPIETASVYNIVEVFYANSGVQDSFDSVTYDLATINPSLLYNNEPVNKQDVTLSLINNDVRAQYLATRFLEGGREDLNLSASIMFTGLQLEAGDVVSVTIAKYGWSAKLFRINQVTENFNSDGTIVIDLEMSEYNPQVYDDLNITQFTPAANTGLGSATTFGTIPVPVIGNLQANASLPSFDVSISTSAAGIVQYAEVWYSAFSNPTDAQRIFAGTTEIQSSGAPYGNSALMPTLSLTNIPAGNWYFFSRMVNAIAFSPYSTASAVINWKPITYQYVDRYLSVAYADSFTGTGFSFSPRGKSYYGLYNTVSANPSSVVENYSWYLADPEPFGTANYLLYCNRGNRKYSFSIDNATYLGINAGFVPSESSVYDQTLWSALEDGNNIIDLDARTGQVTRVGTSSANTSDGTLSVTNNTNGTMVVSLQQFLNFGNGVYSQNFSPSSLTIDIFGRVVGFAVADNFYYTESTFDATAGQTSFSVTHIVGQCLVYRNGVLAASSEYTETSTTVVFGTACVVGETIVIISMRVTSYADFYAPLNTTVNTVGTNTVTYNEPPFQAIVVGDKITFTNTGTPTQYTVSAINLTTKTITFSTTLSGITSGMSLYEFRASGASYTPFTKYELDVTNIASYTPTTYSLRSGFEQIYVNGTQFNEIDYDLATNTIQGFPANISGKLTIIMFEANNLGVPCSNITNTVIYSNTGVLLYNFASNPLSMEVFANGSILAKGSTRDYTATSASYILNTDFPNSFTLLNQQTYARIGAA